LESLFISLISVALVVVATVSMTVSLFTSTVNITDSWRKIEERSELVRRTSIVASPPVSYNGGVVVLTVANNGETNLANFDNWDVIVEYRSGQTNYLSYTSNPVPAANEWTIEGIYLSTNTSMPEVFDIGILNGWETAKIILGLAQEIGGGESVRFTVSTDIGVTSQCIVTRSW
jgi:hypothetical protein